MEIGGIAEPKPGASGVLLIGQSPRSWYQQHAPCQIVRRAIQDESDSRRIVHKESHPNIALSPELGRPGKIPDLHSSAKRLFRPVTTPPCVKPRIYVRAKLLRQIGWNNETQFLLGNWRMAVLNGLHRSRTALSAKRRNIEYVDN